MTDLKQAAMQALEALEDERLEDERHNRFAFTGFAFNATDNLRTTLAQPEQQAEPVLLQCTTCGTVYAEGVPPQVPEQEPSQWRDMVVVNLVREGINKHKARELADHFATQPAAQPAQWERTSASFDEWWDSDVMPPSNPFAEGSAAYWAWAGWQAAQRKWQGLTDEEVAIASAEFDTKLKLAFHAGMYVAQNILKERNNG
jgi:hypothetical protein